MIINRNPYLNQFQKAQIELESENELVLLTAALEEKLMVENDNKSLKDKELLKKMITSLKTQGEPNN